MFYDLIYRIESSSQSCRFAVQSKPPPIYSLPSQKFHHQLTIKSPSLVIFPPFFPFFFVLSPLFYDLTHRIGLVHHLCVPSALFWFCSSPCPWFSCSLFVVWPCLKLYIIIFYFFLFFGSGIPLDLCLCGILMIYTSGIVVLWWFICYGVTL